jgi:hypothetical protein
MTENHWNEERLAELIALLPPAPTAWVRAAQDLPALRRVFSDIVARAEADAAYRATVIADLEAALGAEGIEPSPRILSELRERLAD